MPEVQCFLLLHTPVTQDANRSSCCSLWCNFTEPNSSRDRHSKTPQSEHLAQQQHPPAPQCSCFHPLPGLSALPPHSTSKVPVTAKTRSPKLSIPGHRPPIPAVPLASLLSLVQDRFSEPSLVFGIPPCCVDLLQVLRDQEMVKSCPVPNVIKKTSSLAFSLKPQPCNWL